MKKKHAVISLKIIQETHGVNKMTSTFLPFINEAAYSPVFSLIVFVKVVLLIASLIMLIVTIVSATLSGYAESNPSILSWKTSMPRM